MKAGPTGKTPATTTTTSKTSTTSASSTTSKTSTTTTTSKPTSSNIMLLSSFSLDPKQNTKEYKDNFLKKVQFCSQAFDFNDDAHDVKEKVRKFECKIRKLIE
jgi:serine/threonine-protein phosphatase 2A regulatory subunit B'